MAAPENPVEANARNARKAELHAKIATLREPKRLATIRLQAKFPRYAARVESHLLPQREMLAKLLASKLDSVSALASQLNHIERLLQRVKSEKTIPLGWGWTRGMDPRSALALCEMVAPARRRPGE